MRHKITGNRNRRHPLLHDLRQSLLQFYLRPHTLKTITLSERDFDWMSEEDMDWYEMRPVGNEFGASDED